MTPEEIKASIMRQPGIDQQMAEEFDLCWDKCSEDILSKAKARDVAMSFVGSLAYKYGFHADGNHYKKLIGHAYRRSNEIADPDESGLKVEISRMPGIDERMASEFDQQWDARDVVKYYWAPNRAALEIVDAVAENYGFKEGDGHYETLLAHGYSRSSLVVNPFASRQQHATPHFL